MTVALGVVEATEHEHGHERVVVTAGDKGCNEERVGANLPESTSLVESVNFGKLCHEEEDADHREHGEQTEVEDG